jgi:hypothetical protein
VREDIKHRHVLPTVPAGWMARRRWVSNPASQTKLGNGLNSSRVVFIGNFRVTHGVRPTHRVENRVEPEALRSNCMEPIMWHTSELIILAQPSVTPVLLTPRVERLLLRSKKVADIQL